MGQDQVDGVGGHPGRERLEDVGHPFGVLADPLGLVESQNLLDPDDAALADERHQSDANRHVG